MTIRRRLFLPSNFFRHTFYDVPLYSEAQAKEHLVIDTRENSDALRQIEEMRTALTTFQRQNDDLRLEISPYEDVIAKNAAAIEGQKKKDVVIAGLQAESIELMRRIKFTKNMPETIATLHQQVEELQKGNVPSTSQNTNRSPVITTELFQTEQKLIRTENMYDASISSTNANKRPRTHDNVLHQSYDSIEKRLRTYSQNDSSHMIELFERQSQRLYNK